MATLTTKQRDRMPSNEFALPGGRYPIPDASHAANAKARATQAVNAGRMSRATQKVIDARANKVIGRKTP